jgi:hypothetical protein
LLNGASRFFYASGRQGTASHLRAVLHALYVRFMPKLLFAEKKYGTFPSAFHPLI